MQFGSSWEDVKKEPSGGGGGGFIKYLGEGTTTLRILDEPEKWHGWWEHFDQAATKSYPCTGDRSTCPGCTSDNARTRSASRKIGFNAVSERDGEHYVDLWKVSRKVAERLELRASRNGTIRDRDYNMTRIGKEKQTDYDVDGSDKDVVDLTEFDEQRKDPQTMLAIAFDEAFGDGAAAGEIAIPSRPIAREPKAEKFKDDDPADNPFKAPEDAKPNEPDEQASEIERLRAQLKAQQEANKAQAPEGSKRAETGNVEDPPSEPEAEQDTAAEGEEVDPGEPEVTLEELKAMLKGDLVSLIVTEQKWGRMGEAPKSLSTMTKQDLLDWMLTQ